MNHSLLLKKLWLWRNHNLWIWGETIVLTVFILGICHLANPSNPLFLKEIFPWPWIAGIIVVLKYGLGPGMLSVAVIAASIALQISPDALATINYQNYLLSGFILTFFCALFSSNWIKRVIDAEELKNYTEERLNHLSLAYYMLRISNDSLEKNLITKPITIRSIMSEMQNSLVYQQAKLDTSTAQRFLQLISQHCAVTTAGIYLAQNKKISNKALAVLGSMDELDIHDPLINFCLQSTEACYVAINQLKEMEQCTYLVACPMRDSNNNLLGILVVKEMSFWSLHHETLRVLNILVTYLVEEIVIASDVIDFLQAYPNCPAQFAKELKKLLTLKRNLNMDSALAAVVIAKELRPHNVIYNLMQQQRSLDSVWALEMGKYDVLITLMPLTDASGVQGYLSRISHYLKNNLGLNLAESQKTRTLQLYTAEPLGIMQHFLTHLEECNLATDTLATDTSLTIANKDLSL